MSELVDKVDELVCSYDNDIGHLPEFVYLTPELTALLLGNKVAERVNRRLVVHTKYFDIPVLNKSALPDKAKTALGSRTLEDEFALVFCRLSFFGNYKDFAGYGLYPELSLGSLPRANAV